MSAANPGSPAVRRSGLLFVLGTALATVGGALGLISATGITTSAGSLSRGALDTGLYLAINLAAESLGVPYAPGIAHRLGTGQAIAWLLAMVAIAWTLAGLLKFPIVLVLARWSPRQSIAEPIQPTSAWGGALSVLSQSRTLRAVALLAAGMGLFVSPVLLMAVPLAQVLTPSVQYQAAGLLLASYAVGQLLSPLVVARLRRGRVAVKACARAALGTGMVLMAGGVLAVGATLLLPAMRGDLLLAAGAVVGVSLAACRFGARALMLGAAAESVDRDRAATPLAAVRLCGTLAAPAGVLAWGAILGSQGAGLALIVGGVGIITMAVLVLRMRRMDALAANQ